MASPNAFTVPAETMASWSSRLAPWSGQKAVDETLRDMDAAAKKADAAGNVTLTRHQLWTWAEALSGLAAKLPLAGADAARALAAELRAILGGAPAQAPAPAPAKPAIATGLSWEPSAPAAPATGVAYTPPPAITYVKAPVPAAGSAESTRLVADRDLGPAVQRILRDARQEVLILSPWRGGIDTLLAEILALPPSVAVRIITRRPDPDDPAYHRALNDLRRKGVDMAVSPYVHTRMIIADARTLLLGAASLPGPATPYARESAILTTDPKTVADARVHFANVQREVKGPV